jgi:hypothetical protein
MSPKLKVTVGGRAGSGFFVQIRFRSREVTTLCRLRECQEPGWELSRLPTEKPMPFDVCQRATVSAFLTVGIYARDKLSVNFRTIDRGYLLKEKTADPGGTVRATPS